MFAKCCAILNVERAKMSKLTLSLVSALAEGQDVREIRRLDASKRGITAMEGLR